MEGYAKKLKVMQVCRAISGTGYDLGIDSLTGCGPDSSYQFLERKAKELLVLLKYKPLEFPWPEGPQYSRSKDNMNGGYAEVQPEAKSIHCGQHNCPLCGEEDVCR